MKCCVSPLGKQSSVSSNPATEFNLFSNGLIILGFGGESNPARLEISVQKGDVIVIPAGVGHRLLDDCNGDFEMVGSYPKGRSWDMCYGKQEEEEKVTGITGLGWFEKDPLYGDDGPALKV
jgi:uncharacterized protein YjlB